MTSPVFPQGFKPSTRRPKIEPSYYFLFSSGSVSFLPFVPSRPSYITLSVTILFFVSNRSGTIRKLLNNIALHFQLDLISFLNLSLYETDI